MRRWFTGLPHVSRRHALICARRASACPLLAAILAALLLAVWPSGTAHAQEPSLPPSLIALVTGDAAERAGVAPEDVALARVARVARVVWEDYCVGDETNDSSCMREPIDGYVLWVTAGGGSYRYHTDLTGNIVRFIEKGSAGDIPGAPLPRGATGVGGADSLYTVQPGDTLGLIASRFGSTVAAIASANALINPDAIYVGDRLIIPGDSVAEAPGSGAIAEPYVVHAGDTIAIIARRAGVSPDALISLNGIRDPALIYVGQTLIIPGAGIEPPAAPTRCVDFQHGFVLTVPAGWAATAGARPGTCNRFGPAPQGDAAAVAAITVSVSSATFDEVLASMQASLLIVGGEGATVAGRTAVRIEGYAVSSGAPVRSSRYLVDLGGRTLVAVASGVGAADLAVAQEALDAMMRRLHIIGEDRSPTPDGQA